MVNQELPLDTEDKILNAATKVFGRDGYAGARMQVIADEAGINKALLHYYFRSKEKLFTQIFIEKYNQFFSTLAILADLEGDVFEKLDRIVDAYMEMLSNNPEMPVMLINTMHHHPEIIKKFNVEGGKKFKNFLQHGTGKGEISIVEVLQLTTTVIGMCIMPYLAKPMAINALQIEEADYQKMIDNRGVFVKKAIRAILKS